MPEHAYIVCMNTIIYFYPKREIREPELETRTEAVTEDGKYTLIRVGFDLKGERWFGQDLGQTVPEETQLLLEAEEPDEPCRRGIAGVLQRIRQDRQQMKRRVEAQLRLEQALAAREEQLKVTERQMLLAAERILKRADREGDCSYVCQGDFKKCTAWGAWLEHFPIKEFDGYGQEFWVRQLLPQAVHPHFAILGACEGIEDLIESCAHRMKSVKWILKEQEYTPARRDFVEMFCEEYGIAIALWTVPGRAAYRKLRPICPEPANILDFTDETGIPVSGIAEGSVWLDMRSSEEKCRRIGGRSTGIRYFSLKERWKRGV